jgi:signal transduction histidine kinase
MKVYKQIRIIYITAGISIAILIVLGMLYMQKSREQVRYINAVEHTHKVLSSINFFEKLLIETETSQRGYLLTGDEHIKEEFQSHLALIDSSLESIALLTSDNFGQKTYLYQLQKFVAIRVQLLKENLSIKIGAQADTQNLRQGMMAMDHCKNYMSKMRATEEALLDSRLATKDKYQQLNLNFFIITFITACLICILAIGVFFRELGIRLATQQNLRGKINELSNSKNELEQVTFAASHDLQEPMRKVRILSSMITKKFMNKIPESDMEVIHRINKVTEKMQGQLSDLVLYTNLLAPIEHFEDINLSEVFKNAYDELFKNTSADLIISDQLPIIKGSLIQIETMLNHLLENAAKFKDPNRPLTVTVHYKTINVRESKILWDNRSVKQYHQVTISDNGIGFDSQYNDKIFGLFQRLHTQTEYPGKGIGLSIARRVMSNHNGFITAAGEKAVGASFVLQFPE